MFRTSPRLALATAALLLTFTLIDLGGDLIGASFCAADATTEDSAAAPSPPLKAGKTRDERSADPEHIDDCFCCSGCVETSPLFSVDVAIWTVQSLTPETSGSRTLPPAELYRPPRAS